MLLMLCRWKKEDRQTLLTCASIVKCSIKMALRLRAEGDGVMLLSPMIISLMLERCPTVGVRNSNERVFSSFSFSRFISIHSFISITQASIRLIVSTASCWSNTMYNWVSSAYKWAISPCRRTILDMGAEYNVNRSGPSTDPWGTPYLSNLGFDVVLRIFTDCVLPLR